MSDFEVQVGAALDSQSLLNLKSQIEKTEIKLSNVSVDSSALDNIQKSLKNLTIKVPEITIKTPKAAKFETQKKALENKISKWETDNSVSAQKFEEKINNIKSSLKKADKITFNNLTGEFNKVIKKAKDFEKTLKTKDDIFNWISQDISEGRYEAQIAQFQKRLGQYSSKSKEYSRTKASLENLSDVYQELKSAQKAFSDNRTDNNYQRLVSAQKEIESVIRNTSNQFKILDSAQTKVLSSASKASAIKSFEIYWEKNTKALKKYNQEYEELRNQVYLMETKGEKETFDTSFKNLQAKILKNGDEGKSFSESFKSVFSTVGKFAATYNIQQRVLEASEQMIRNIVEIDSAMTELKKVSDIRDSQIGSFFKQANAQAQEYGATLTDVINSTADWSRLGFNIAQSEELTKASLLYRNVGDNMTMDEVNENLISTLQGFQLDSTQAVDIIDKINEVANNYAIDSRGLGEALRHSAASFNAANTDLSKSIALITATNTVVQDPSAVGNMWKTVGMRIRGAKTELEEAGEDTDGLVESTSELRDMVKQMTGFDIMKDNNTYKDLYEIVIGIGEQWDKLSDINQASLLEALAGKRQGNALTATLQNIDLVKAAYESAINSTGSAERENAKYQESIQYSLDRIKASFQQISADTINSDLFKGIVDGGNTAVQVTDKLISKFGMLNTILAGFGIYKLFSSGKAQSFYFYIECATGQFSREVYEAA